MDQAERFRQLLCTQAVRADLSARSVRAAAITACVGFADFALRIGSAAWLARLVLPEHFGLVMMATAVTAVAEQLRDMGLSSATVQQKEITHAEVTNLFWINAAVGAVLATCVCAASPLIAAYYHEPRLTVIACVLASTLLFGGLTVQHQALLTRQLKLAHTSGVRLASSILSTALAIGLAAAGYGYWALLWREVSRAVLLAAGMWLFFPWVPGLPSRKTNVRPLLTFGANITAANILSTIISGFDRFLLGRFWGATPVAMYRQSYQLISAPTDQLLNPLYDVTHPGLSMLQTEPDRYRRFYRKVLSLVCVITMPVSLVVAVYSKEVTAILLGPKWSDAAPLLMLLSLGTFFKQALSSTALILITRGKAKMHLMLTVLQNVVAVLGMCVGVRWGTTGFAVADAVTVYVMIAPRLYFTLKDSPVSAGTFFGTVTRPVISGAAMAATLIATRSLTSGMVPAIAVACATGLGCLVFAGAWLLQPGGIAEFSSLAADVRGAFARKRASRQSAAEAVGAAAS